MFKSIKKRRPLRQKTSESGDEEDEEVDKDAIEETLELQRLRKRANGVNAATLASGKKVSRVDELVHNDPDPFKLKTGGLLSLEKARRAKSSEESGGIDDTIVGTQFSKETRVRDEDEEMRKFIEAEMERRRGAGADADDADADHYLSPEDRALLSLPDYLRRSNAKRSEEMLSSQMLSGIPEVDLGIDEKIRNIEATESAKKRLAEDRTKKRSRPSEFVPTNLAVNFRQPNRFRTDDGPGRDERAARTVTEKTVVVGQMPAERVVLSSEPGSAACENDPTRATDDLHLTKFKKHFQRK